FSRDHEDDVVGHEAQHRSQIAGLAGSHPRFNEASNRPFVIRRHRLAHNSLLLALDITLQPTDCLVPLLRDELKISAHICKSRLLQLPDALAPPPRPAAQPWLLKDRK